MGVVRETEYEKKLRAVMAKRLRAVRGVLGLSQSEMAEKLNISRQSLYYYERGARSIDVCVLAKLRQHFRVSPDWMMGLTNSDKRTKSAIDKRMDTSYNE